MGVVDVFTWEAGIFNGALGSALIAATGISFGLDPFIILVAICFTGSAASVGFRWIGGFLPDWKNRALAFFAGPLFAVPSIWALEMKGIEDLEAGVFVLCISLMGARIVKNLSTDFDVTAIMAAIASRLSKIISDKKE